jgi:hypothetical protein
MFLKRTYREVVLAVAVVALLIYGVHAYTRPVPAAFQVNGHTILLEIADSNAERERGLGGRESIDENTGMLFVFTRPDRYQFWMLHMLFPIDIVWLDEDFVVVDLVEGISPDTYPELFTPAREARSVLEIGAGNAQKFGIAEGTKLTPVFDN